MKGPAIFLAQFAGDEPPFDKLETMAQWAAALGYVGVQVPTDPKLFDLALAAESQTYCDEIAGKLADAGIAISELSTHLQGQLVAVHPAYAPQFAAFAPPELRDKPAAWQAWATEQLKYAAKASRRLKLAAHATFSGALLWHTMYPWPQRPAGLVEAGFKELARRWRPILDAFDEAGVDVAFEIHPGEDLHDGATFERFLDAVGGHPRANILFDPSHFVLQQLDYIAFIDLYQGIPRQGRRVPAKRALGRVRRLSGLDRQARPLPLARRRSGQFHADLLEARAIRLRRLGRARVGVRAEASRGRRARRRTVHPLAHDSPRGPRVRRLRGELDGLRRARTHPRASRMTITGGDA
jgi:sugar phosphate isomerase/epimerase